MKTACPWCKAQVDELDIRRDEGYCVACMGEVVPCECDECLDKREASTDLDDPDRCRYGDCAERHPVALAGEWVTCPTCRKDLGLPPLDTR